MALSVVITSPISVAFSRSPSCDSPSRMPMACATSPGIISDGIAARSLTKGKASTVVSSAAVPCGASTLRVGAAWSSSQVQVPFCASLKPEAGTRSSAMVRR